MFNTFKLPSGLTVITENIPFVRSVALGIWIKNGSRNESQKNTGISHFIEHMFFKGTNKRTAADIAEAMDAIGGQLNAYTAKEYTCYYSITLDSHFDSALEILSDMFFNSNFDNGEIKKELNVILEEINMYEDTPEELVYDLLQANVFKNNSLGFSILGEKETISSFNQNDLKKYYNNNYHPENTVIAIAGNIGNINIKEKIDEYFQNFGKKSPYTANDYKAVYKPAVVTKEKDIEQVHLLMGYPGLPLGADNAYDMIAFNTLFGGGMSSRLFQKIREEHGLAYSIYSYNASFINNGLYSIYAAVSPEQFLNVISLINTETNNFFKNKITQNQLDKTKEQLKSKYLLSLESSSSRMTSIGKSQLLLNRILDQQYIIDKINAITLKSVYDIAEQTFDSKNYSFSAVGPVSEFKVSI